jgi:glycerate kinase
VACQVVVCMDKFRGSLRAGEACAALARGIRAAAPSCEVREIPVADGGEGTVDALVRAGYERRAATAHDPAGRPVRAEFAVRGSRAVVELAQASGLHHVAGREIPLTASTFGTGEVIRAALDAGCTAIVLAVGGSATTDGGAGMLRALGARLLAADGTPAGPGGAGLLGLARIDLTGLDPRLAHTDISLASDVSNPLLGPDGAAAVYGPQKGASPSDIAVLEQGLERLATAMAQVTGTDRAAEPGAGAAGGTGFAALAALGARCCPGIEFMLTELGVPGLLRAASLAVTGEGRLDSQSLRGKAPAGVAALAAQVGVPLVLVAGQSLLTGAQLRALDAVAAYSLVAEAGSIEEAMSEAAPLLTRIGRQLAVRHLIRP